MAEDKKKNKGAFGSELLGQDFLAEQTKAINEAGQGGGLFSELKKMGAMEAYRPVVTNIQKQQAWQPVLDMYNTKEEERRSRLAQFIEKNPTIDESQLHPGAGDVVAETMKENNLRFRELNKKLMFMNADHPEYADAVNEINKINQTSIDLRADNKKLLELKNLMIEEGPEGVEERTRGLSKSQSDMYDDILAGTTDNFKMIDGKLHWVDPTAKMSGEKRKPILVADINAGTDLLYKNNLAEREHLKLKKLASEAKMLDPQMLNHKVKSLFKMIGNKGVKSMIFDADETSGFYDTKGWFVDWLTSQGIEPTTTDGQYTPEALAEFERIKEDGILSMGKNPQYGNVKNHFAKWYASQLTADKGSMLPPTTPTKGGKTQNKNQYAAFEGGEEEETKVYKPIEVPDAIKGNVPSLNEDNTYEGQTGSGDNFGIIASPFAGITQYGWTAAGLSNDDHLFELGKGSKVETTLNDEYGKYGFTFKAAKGLTGGFGDRLTVTFGDQTEVFEFDNVGKKDQTEAQRLQEFMHRMVGMKVGGGVLDI